MCGAKPWKSPWARDRVWHVGLTYKLIENGRKACCAAQMFLGSGDGVVFVGKFGTWYSRESGEFHSPPEKAEAMLRGTVNTYMQEHGRALKEIFLHAHSGIGFKSTKASHGRSGRDLLPRAGRVHRLQRRLSATAKALRDGWFHTGDLGRMDERGLLYITGRESDMYISGGSNVYPREVEEVLLTHPGVAEVAVVGVPDAKWGEIGVAVVVRRASMSGLSANELMAHLEGRCAK